MNTIKHILQGSIITCVSIFSAAAWYMEGVYEWHRVTGGNAGELVSMSLTID